MTNIHSISKNAVEALSNICRQGIQTVCEWRGHVVQVLQKNPPLAIGVIGTANVLFFAVMHVLINCLDRAIENRVALSDKQKKYKHFLLDGGLIGGSVFVFNLLLSKLTKHPLSQIALTAMAATAIALHLILNSFSTNNKETKIEIEVKPVKIESEKSQNKLEAEIKPEKTESEKFPNTLEENKIEESQNDLTKDLKLENPEREVDIEPKLSEKDKKIKKVQTHIKNLEKQRDSAGNGKAGKRKKMALTLQIETHKNRLTQLIKSIS